MLAHRKKNKKIFQYDTYHPLALTVYASPVSTRCRHWGGGCCPQLNKFEQISSLDRRISLSGVISEQTHMCENIAFQQFRWRAVKISITNVLWSPSLPTARENNDFTGVCLSTIGLVDTGSLWLVCILLECFLVNIFISFESITLYVAVQDRDDVLL